ncbi:hypothetical protein Mapa_018640 [Marchantia paleacea]|nr:hypothetical protein Mapa_018640 [Marchantia paleacea]
MLLIYWLKVRRYLDFVEQYIYDLYIYFLQSHVRLIFVENYFFFLINYLHLYHKEYHNLLFGQQYVELLQQVFE